MQPQPRQERSLSPFNFRLRYYCKVVQLVVRDFLLSLARLEWYDAYICPDSRKDIQSREILVTFRKAPPPSATNVPWGSFAIVLEFRSFHWLKMVAVSIPEISTWI